MNTTTRNTQPLALAKSEYLHAPEREGVIDLVELWRVFWSGKWILLATTLLFVAIGVAYALWLPNVYKSEALLAPVSSEEEGLSGLASQFGGLASLAGVNLKGGGGIEDTALALEILQSRQFLGNFIKKHQLLVPLMAAKGWDREQDKLVIDESLYDLGKQEWVRPISPPFGAEPSELEAYRAFLDILSVEQDSSNSLITISIEHYSAQIAKNWVDLLVDEINFEMKTRDLLEANKSIEYLEQQLEKTNLNELQKVLFQLIEEQTKTIMFAEVREQYAFKTIDPAFVAELKAGPKRALIVILVGMLGGILAMILVLTRHFILKSKTS